MPRRGNDFVVLTGDAEIDAALRRVISPTAKKAMAQAMRAAMKEYVLPTARANAARLFGHRRSSIVRRKVRRDGSVGRSISTHLKDSIKVKATRTRRGVFGVGVRTGTREELGLSEDAKGYYPVALEYGWVTARGGKRVPPRPYMRPALWDNRDRVVRAFGSGVFLALRKMFHSSGYGGLVPPVGMRARKVGRPRA